MEKMRGKEVYNTLENRNFPLGGPGAASISPAPEQAWVKIPCDVRAPA
jgi:hypothetical protein